MSTKKITAIRGMNDILPDEIIYWHYLENTFREIAESYCYQEIRTPLLENTALFHRGIGEATDIVEKETYTFNDRNGDSLTLRPEGTASTVRAGIEHSLFYNQVQRLWYMGPIFRYERPQKGRYRQFYQIGIEAFGMPGHDIELELLYLTWRLWEKLGLAQHLELHINSLGPFAERQAYSAALVEYFSQHHDELDEDSQRRLLKNPLRILDSKNPSMQALIEKAPKLDEFLSDAAKQHFAFVCQGLDAAKIPYKINQRLVRGLDYYCHTVFEWVSNDLGAQGTVCAGGRYDNLVAEIGGDNVPAVGFAMGIERILLLLKQRDLVLQNNPDIYIISEQNTREAALELAELIRTMNSDLKVLAHCGDGSFKSQMKRADKSAATVAIILGEQEVARQTVSLKYLRETKDQETLERKHLNAKLQQLFNVRS
jgi:histidyl-tRNA synthetase